MASVAAATSTADTADLRRAMWDPWASQPDLNSAAEAGGSPARPSLAVCAGEGRPSRRGGVTCLPPRRPSALGWPHGLGQINLVRQTP